MSEQKITVAYGGGDTHSQNPVFRGYGVSSALPEQVAVRHPPKLLGVRA